ncbi:hypothetical protein OAJ74_02560, partial [Alphaproteobacteria bacterium]|nr:hypothetical protein [Alphaproteobacteria bacterium]
MFWLNEIGPHLIVFMLALIIFYLTFKYLNNFRKLNIYLILLVTQTKNVFTGMTVEENLEMGAFLRKGNIQDTINQILNYENILLVP